jgi:predicted chitinase
MCNADECVWVKIPGANNVSIQVRSGIPAVILPAFIARFNQLVEPVRDPDTACWTLTNSVSTSNHPAGVATDVNWSSHPFHAKGTFGDRLPRVRQCLEEFRGCVDWGGDWTNPIDEMHFELAHREGYIDRDTKQFVLDVDQRLIDLANDLSAGYLGIYGPGTTPPPPPAPSGAADLLARATGVSQAKAQEILPGVVNGLRDSQCNTVNRIAMWLAQIGHESAGFNATEEYEDGDESTDRWKYKGRTWIQITWRSNYAGLSEWAFGKGLIPSPTYFVDNPKKLAEIQYAGLGPAWYWTVARPQINSLCDNRDLVAVTQAINGGQNGAADRKRRYDLALGLGDQLLELLAPSDTDPLEELLMSDLEVESLSLYATPGERNIPIVRMLQAIDAAEHRKLVEDSARQGDADSLARIQRVAAGQGKYRDSGAIAHARAVLSEIGATNPAVLEAFINTTQGVAQ